MLPSSALAYTMRRFDPGLGSTDSQRLVDAKCSLYFCVLPRLLDALLSSEDFLADVNFKFGEPCAGDDIPGHEHSK